MLGGGGGGEGEGGALTKVFVVCFGEEGWGSGVLTKIFVVCSTVGEN